jgi:hypothetical protein
MLKPYAARKLVSVEPVSGWMQARDPLIKGRGVVFLLDILPKDFPLQTEAR